MDDKISSDLQVGESTSCPMSSQTRQVKLSIRFLRRSKYYVSWREVRRNGMWWCTYPDPEKFGGLGWPGIRGQQELRTEIVACLGKNWRLRANVERKPCILFLFAKQELLPRTCKISPGWLDPKISGSWDPMHGWNSAPCWAWRRERERDGSCWLMWI